jgi:hypothetical protein
MREDWGQYAAWISGLPGQCGIVPLLLLNAPADTSDEAMARKAEEREMEAYRLDQAARGLHHFYQMDEDGEFYKILFRPYVPVLCWLSRIHILVADESQALTSYAVANLFLRHFNRSCHALILIDLANSCD